LWDDDPRLPQVEATLWPAAGSEPGLWGRLRWEWRVLFPPKNEAPDAAAWVNRGELAFVRASVSERSGFRQKLLGAVAAFVIAVVALSGLAWWQRGVAALAARQAQSNELAAQSRLAFSESALSTGLLLASESYRLSRSAPPFYAPQAQQALFDDLNETGGRPQALAGKAVFQTAVSHDGNWLATGSTDNHVRLWSVAELWANPYAQPREIGSHGKDHPVITVAFSPDSAWLATGSTDGVVGLWPIANQESSTQGKGVQISLPTTDGHLSVPRSVMFSPKGQWLVVVGTDGNTWFYERQSLLRDPTPQPRFRLNATEWPINTEARPPVAFDPDERHLAAASMNNAIWLWDFDNLLLNPSSAPLTATLSSGGYPISIMFSPDGNWFAATSSYAIAYLWRIENVAQPTPDAPIARIHPLVAERQSQGTAFSPDGRWFAVRNANSVSLWDLASLPQTITTVGILKSLVPTMNPTGTDPVEAFAEQTPTRSFTVPGITSVEFSSDERSVLAGDSRGRLQLWDFQAVERGDLRPRADLLAHEKEVAGIFAVPGNDIVITQSNDGDIRLWKTSNPQAEAGIVSRDIGAAAFDLAISPDGRWVATGGIDGQVRLWDASQLREDPLAEPTIVGEHSGGRMVMSVAFSPDGVWLASGGADGAFGLWPTDPSVPRRQATDALIPLPTTEGRMLIARNITFSPQGRWLAVSDSDGNILLYNFAELTQNTRPQPFIVDHARWRINPEAQPPISFSPDEQRLAAASLDNAAWIWSIDDLVTRSTVAVPITVPFGALVSAVSFSSDGNWFAIGSSNAIRLWKPQALIKNPNTRAFAEITPEADSFVELAFSSDNQLLVATNQNRTLLWYVEALRAHAHARPIALRGITASHDYLAVAPKGEWLATLASMQNEGHLALWTVAPDLRVKQACAIAGRNLTAKEWQFYFPATAPGKICDQWPAPTSTSTQLDHAEESR
ncbi:MAG: hypothetical protein K1X65_24470, partial [Caldilineales bacterium]|nr:hypothetical protein [Caldilineales bacterium]